MNETTFPTAKAGNLITRQIADEVERLGGQVIACWCNAERRPDCPDVVVLARMPGHQAQPWVTWTNAVPEGLCWGHYFSRRQPAWNDFIDRCEGSGAA